MADQKPNDKDEIVISDRTSNDRSLTINADGTARQDIRTIAGASLTLGQKTMANSVPTVISSDQTPLPFLNQLTQKIEAGLYFVGQDFATGIGNGSTRDVLIITGATAKAHARIRGSDLAGYYQLYESPTTTANGTALSVVNLERSSSNTAALTMFHTPTVTGVGTSLLIFDWATAAKSPQSLFDGDQKIVLKANTKYLIRFNSQAGSNVSNLTVNFYEG